MVEGLALLRAVGSSLPNGTAAYIPEQLNLHQHHRCKNRKSCHYYDLLRCRLQDLIKYVTGFSTNVKVKVKFSYYRPKQALGDPEG